MGVVGGGAWGTALAHVMASHGLDVVLWALEKETVDDINGRHENKTWLADVPLHEGLRATGDMADLDACDYLFMVSPTQHVRDVSQSLCASLSSPVPIIVCSKGVELKTGMLLHEVLRQTMARHDVLALSGPSFAEETARMLPTTVLLAGENRKQAQRLCRHLSSATFRPYVGTDVVGCLLSGAIKNVLAIGAGIVVGRGFGENARAALITRGMAEMRRMAKACGAKTATINGLAGCGDLMLTCMSMASRNTSVGYRVGRGETLEHIIHGQQTVAEGVATARSLMALSSRQGVEMPLCHAIHDVLYEGSDIDKMVYQLMTRPLVAEEPVR
ncbi:MAG: NAD(P)-dependent glycerol-3-phosphate dehydrogenase [Alphaproteobacteria bacterium GM7ARS4]|nr:NAD(P)-dependent glycerol-3-phosphate dehydrogenase [Alphaproteobacteria bacterium GM7ARS4]